MTSDLARATGSGATLCSASGSRMCWLSGTTRTTSVSHDPLARKRGEQKRRPCIGGVSARPESCAWPLARSKSQNPFVILAGDGRRPLPPANRNSRAYLSLGWTTSLSSGGKKSGAGGTVAVGGGARSGVNGAPLKWSMHCLTCVGSCRRVQSLTLLIGGGACCARASTGIRQPTRTQSAVKTLADGRSNELKSVSHVFASCCDLSDPAPTVEATTAYEPSRRLRT